MSTVARNLRCRKGIYTGLLPLTQRWYWLRKSDPLCNVTEWMSFLSVAQDTVSIFIIIADLVKPVSIFPATPLALWFYTIIGLWNGLGWWVQGSSFRVNRFTIVFLCHWFHWVKKIKHCMSTQNLNASITKKSQKPDKTRQNFEKNPTVVATGFALKVFEILF